MLTKNQLKQLRKEIVLNSLFLNDYNNSLFIKNKTVCAFMDSYIEYLYEIAHENNFKSNDITDVLNEYDNIENLYNYYLLFEDDPLKQDDYKYYYCLNVYYAIVIYEIEYSIDDYAITSFFDGYRQVKRISKNKIYYDKNSNAFIKVYGCKYYLNNFSKNN